jgi:AcrR family transcriptional regulator
MAQTRRKRSRPGTLSLDAILDTAMALARRDGVGAITMRGIADELGVSAMGLYRYVLTKEDLLGRVADRYFAEVHYPTDNGASWQERVAEVFRSVRRVLLDHPDLAQILSAQPVDGPAAYRGAEVVLQALREAGLAGEAAVGAFDTLRSFTTGFTLRESARNQPKAPRSLYRLHDLESLPPEEFPQVRALAGLLIVADADERFEEGLALLIAGIEHTIADSSEGSPAPAPVTRRGSRSTSGSGGTHGARASSARRSRD